LRKVLLPVFSVLVLALACNGAVWADALHGQCNGTGTGTCSDNGFNTPLGNSTTFGFTISSGPQTGDLLIDILVPNNYAVPTSFAINFASTNTLAGTANQVGGVWSSGSLASFLGFGASPNNPIGAYLPTTQTLDSGATGFFVFQADLGTMTIPANSGATTASGLFNVPTGFGADHGGYIVAFCGTGCTGNGYVATANSGALLVPEPASLTMLFVGLLSLILLTRRRVLTA
jgi:hypothetical protein